MFRRLLYELLNSCNSWVLCDIIGSIVHYYIKQIVLKMFWSKGRHYHKSQTGTSAAPKICTDYWKNRIGVRWGKDNNNHRKTRNAVIHCDLVSEGWPGYSCHAWMNPTDFVHRGQNTGKDSLLTRITLMDVRVHPEWIQDYHWRLMIVITYIIFHFGKNFFLCVFNLSTKKEFLHLKLLFQEDSYSYRQQLCKIIVAILIKIQTANTCQICTSE